LFTIDLNRSYDVAILRMNNYDFVMLIWKSTTLYFLFTLKSFSFASYRPCVIFFLWTFLSSNFMVPRTFIDYSSIYLFL